MSMAVDLPAPGDLPPAHIDIRMLHQSRRKNEITNGNPQF